ncbi:MAG TPA: sigma-70 family RNA polymerase sigma factor [Bryobacteraceae bacterium]|nr:sigma-70 family RNA polymerase sigma factor [Bryobacteraceae bacterium]
MSDTPSGARPVQENQWVELVEKIKQDEDGAMEELYRVFSRGVRFYLCRQLGPQDLDDKMHEVFLIVVQAIRRGDLRDPERLMGYVRTVVRRQVAAYIEEVTEKRRQYTDLDYGLAVRDDCQTPEQAAIRQQHHELAWSVLNGIGRRDREILVRFYLQEQTAGEICRDMALTETQFRLLKSRAKARFGELGKRRLNLRRLVRFW